MAENEKDLPKISGMEGVPVPAADYVQINLAPSLGQMLSFTQNQPQGDDHRIVSQVFLPHDVAVKLGLLILRNAEIAQKETGRKYLPDDLELNIKEKIPE